MDIQELINSQDMDRINYLLCQSSAIVDCNPHGIPREVRLAVYHALEVLSPFWNNRETPQVTWCMNNDGDIVCFDTEGNRGVFYHVGGTGRMVKPYDDGAWGSREIDFYALSEEYSDKDFDYFPTDNELHSKSFREGVGLYSYSPTFDDSRAGREYCQGQYADVVDGYIAITTEYSFDI